MHSHLDMISIHYFNIYFSVLFIIIFLFLRSFIKFIFYIRFDHVNIFLICDTNFDTAVSLTIYARGAQAAKQTRQALSDSVWRDFHIWNKRTSNDKLETLTIKYELSPYSSKILSLLKSNILQSNQLSRCRRVLLSVSM